MSNEPLYLGRVVDPATMKPGTEPLTLKADRLTRHAVCFGMTGSGKTGLCVTLLEELASKGVPVLVLDPKGDMTNLALAFKGHEAADFEPWVDGAEADRKGITTAQLAEKTAAMWRGGLADWDVTPERIAAFTEGSDVSILTPGSNAGIPINVLSALRLPPPELREDPETLVDLVTGTVSSLLGLVGIEADPVEDPEHIVLSTILSTAWTAGTDLDVEGLILQLVDPPFGKVGVFPVDTFFPRRERMKLAMKLNGIVASPAFASWSEGLPLDIDALLAPVNGKTPIRILYGAHLDDTQRMFFFATVLNRVVAWSRRQSGTSALRALVYFDEVMGFLPPHPKNPPTKNPMLTLMKQARAVGVGTMLVTQNPVDVDYKALSNAGTWFIGRLQTDNDRERVLDGLSSAGGIDRKTMTSWIQDLPGRTFVLRDVKEKDPLLFHSRWAISYLRGPLTRQELERLDQPRPDVAPAPVASAAPSAPTAPADDGLTNTLPARPDGTTFGWLHPSAVFNARLQEHFESQAIPRRDDGKIVWKPALYARLNLTFDEGRNFKEDRSAHRLFFPLDGTRLPEAVPVELTESDILRDNPDSGLYAALPDYLDEPKEFKQAERDIVEHAWRTENTTLRQHKGLKLVSLAGESEADFMGRLDAAIEGAIDERVAKEKESTDRTLSKLAEKVRKLEQKKDLLDAKRQAQVTSEMAGAAETVFRMFFGGRRKSVATLARERQRSSDAAERVSQADEDLAQLHADIAAIGPDLADAIATIDEEERSARGEVEVKEVGMEKSDLRVDDFLLLWVPVTRSV